MRCKWYFRNDVSESFSQLPAFGNKSNWNPPKGYPTLEMFLIQLEGDIFSVLQGNTSSYNLTKNEWLAMRGLAEDRSIIIKPADKKLLEQSNRMFKQLLSKKSMSSEEYKYFTYIFKKSTNLGKMYFLPKMHERAAQLYQTVVNRRKRLQNFRIIT